MTKSSHPRPSSDPCPCPCPCPCPIFALALILLAAPGVASASPCDSPLADPVPTPLRDSELDTQRGACIRSELGADTLAHALIDTPGFHGLLGADLLLRGSYVLGTHLELGARLRVIDAAFAQTAVNTVTNTGVGPLVLTAAYTTDAGGDLQLAVAGELEVPATRDTMDTLRTGGQLAALATARLSRTWWLHARIGAFALAASSDGGDTERLGLRAGADLAWHPSPSFSLAVGADASAGWSGAGFDTVLARLTVQHRLGHGSWRFRAGAGVPLGGAERTTAILDLGIIRAL